MSGIGVSLGERYRGEEEGGVFDSRAGSGKYLIHTEGWFAGAEELGAGTSRRKPPATRRRPALSYLGCRLLRVELPPNGPGRVD